MKNSFTRMSVEQFNSLHDLLKPKLQKKSRREPLSAETCVAATLNFLAHGDSIMSTAHLFRIGRSTLYSIIPEVCKAIWEVLQPLYLQCPRNEEEWLKIADKFYNIWNFSNCIGAVDGKHCRIQAPAHSDSMFHNYKGYFSFILMGLVDARYRFIWVDTGNYVSLNDAGIWSSTDMCHALENNTISIPQARPIPYANIILPFCMAGDEGFPLKTYLMRPYAKRNLLGNEQKVFNYRLSRARRIVENAFGILTSRWRILRTPISLKVDTAETIIQAVTCLHNFIITTASNNNLYIQPGIADREEFNGNIIPGNWRNLATNNECMINLGRVGANIGAVTMRQRDILARYFMSEEGSISFQWQHI